MGVVTAGVTDAMNGSMLPRSILVLGVARVTEPGEGRPLALLPPPHPIMEPRNADMDRTANPATAQRRMHPPRPAGPGGFPDESRYILENVQCRGQPGIEQGEGRRARPL